ncbi:hypothetical protein GCM10019016_078800 [Streptomyces prasinosporus]|uniref:Uncharacterized protein n=2 Tax=Streptomyces TaxID=1883 RepID=A0ABP6U266_9ACTN|nr:MULTISPECIES: hypothetical protein [Streptomyces]MCG0062783.1 hypothetical protein [Streptomyces tricolor]GHC13568.1 hypothetical protein GCM10010332_49020 [Streptomyces albogriseolus]
MPTTILGTNRASGRTITEQFTALYARRLIDDHPHWAGVFELRRRRAA